MSDYLGDCEALEKRYPELAKVACCTSCHDEWHYEVGEPLQVTDDDGYFGVCCSQASAFGKMREALRGET